MCSPRGGSWVSKTIKLPDIFRQIKSSASQAQNFVCKRASEPFHGLCVAGRKQATGRVRVFAILVGSSWSWVRIPESPVKLQFSFLWLTMCQNGNMRSETFSLLKTGVGFWHSRANLFSDVTAFPHLLTWPMWQPHEFSWGSYNDFFSFF